MKTILLVCSAGMSTSLLVTKMESAAKEAGVDCKIFALPFSDAPRVLEEVDCILLGPQVRFQKAAIEKLAAGRKAGPVPVDIIDMRDYGTMNGKAVFDFSGPNSVLNQSAVLKSDSYFSDGTPMCSSRYAQNDSAE